MPKIKESGEALTVYVGLGDWYGNRRQIQAMEFADGSVMTLADILADGNHGTDGDDVIYNVKINNGQTPISLTGGIGEERFYAGTATTISKAKSATTPLFLAVATAMTGSMLMTTRPANGTRPGWSV